MGGCCLRDDAGAVVRVNPAGVAVPDAEVRQLVREEVGLPRAAQVLADKLVEEQALVAAASGDPWRSCGTRGSAAAPQAAGLIVVDTPLRLGHRERGRHGAGLDRGGDTRRRAFSG